MQPSSPTEPQVPLRSRLTDLEIIAARVDLLRAEGHSKLSIWRHFLDRFAVDLDALSLIMAELFSGEDESAGMPAEPGNREAA